MNSIDFEDLLECVRLGIQRTSIFMGLGVHAASDPSIRSYDLSSQTKLKIAPDTEDASLLQEYKDEFQRWVIANGLRELHEAFVEYLEKLNQACLTIDWVAGRLTSHECDLRHKKFHKTGFPEKLKRLREDFDVQTLHEEGLLSLNSARNCLTHRRGVIGSLDVGNASGLCLRWRTLEIYFVPADGEPILNRNIPSGGLDACGGAIESKYVERNFSIGIGQILALEPLQLAEICFFADEAAVELANSAVAFASSQGIEVRNRPDTITADL